MVGNISFDVPKGAYSKLYLLISSSYGACTLTVNMTYADGSSSPTTFDLPDWGTGQPLPTTPPIFFDLASGMHKWTAQDQQVDAPVHTLTGVVLSPDGTRELVHVQVSKPGDTQTLVFWGATGVADLAVDAAVEDVADTGASDAGVAEGVSGETNYPGDAVASTASGDASDETGGSGASNSGMVNTSGAGANSGTRTNSGTGASSGMAANSGTGAPSGSTAASGGSTSGVLSHTDAAAHAGCAMSHISEGTDHFWTATVALTACAFRYRGRNPKRDRTPRNRRQGRADTKRWCFPRPSRTP
jgi:hypothetical protein